METGSLVVIVLFPICRYVFYKRCTNLRLTTIVLFKHINRKKTYYIIVNNKH